MIYSDNHNFMFGVNPKNLICVKVNDSKSTNNYVQLVGVLQSTVHSTEPATIKEIILFQGTREEVINAYNQIRKMTAI